LGISLRLINFTELFNTATRIPIIINDFQESSEEDKAVINNLIYTKYSGDLLSNLPTCECGELVGELNIGIICPNCRKPVESIIGVDLEPILWIRAPNGVADLMNPVVWTMLNEKFTRSGFSIIRWLCDTGYKPTVKIPLIMEAVMDLGIPRGWNNFVNNFTEIMKSLFDIKGFRLKKGVEEPLEILLREYRDCVFSRYLPLPNRSLLVIEETNVGTYVDPIITGAVDAIRTMVGIDSVLINHNVRMKENRTVKTIDQLARFCDDLAKSTLAKKEGIFRKHIFGTRSHFSFRGVISSLTEIHDYEEIHIPWGIGVSVFRIHLMNKLLRRGFTINETIAFLNEHTQKFHPVLDELFKQLISESPNGKGPSCIMQRNPSLERGSAQAVYITKVKTDTNIQTVSMSILTTKGLNADYDGDQLNFTLSIDSMIEDGLYPLAPHKSVFDLNEPKKVSVNLSMPKTVLPTINAWLNDKEEKIDLIKLGKMECLYM